MEDTIRPQLLNIFFLCLIYMFFHACRLQGLGFERGWGDTAEHVLEMMHLLLDILQAPDPSTLEQFLGRIPMVFNVVILSPHGYFGQANVLGLPDTGGQVFITSVTHCKANCMPQKWILSFHFPFVFVHLLNLVFLPITCMNYDSYI